MISVKRAVFDLTGVVLPADRVFDTPQWRTEGGGCLGCSNPPPRNSEDISGVLERISKKNRHIDFLLQFTVFS